jgi:hypothetical protein
MNKYLPRRFSYSFIVVHKKIVKTDTEIIQINILTDPAFVLPIFFMPILLSLYRDVAQNNIYVHYST